MSYSNDAMRANMVATVNVQLGRTREWKRGAPLVRASVLACVNTN